MLTKSDWPTSTHSLNIMRHLCHCEDETHSFVSFNLRLTAKSIYCLHYLMIANYSIGHAKHNSTGPSENKPNKTVYHNAPYSKLLQEVEKQELVLFFH